MTQLINGEVRPQAIQHLGPHSLHSDQGIHRWKRAAGLSIRDNSLRQPVANPGQGNEIIGFSVIELQRFAQEQRRPAMDRASG
jgi:hypothetical protein